MLQRVDRIILRVPNVQAGVRHYRDVLGLRLLREDQRVAVLQFPHQETELVLHSDPDLPTDATYYLVNDVRDLFARRADLKLQFVQNPAPVARGFRAAIRDPFGNTLLIVDRTNEQSAAVEDAKAPGMLFPGVEEPPPLNRDLLVQVYESVGRTADDLPYTPDFEKLYALYGAKLPEPKPSRGEVWRQLLNLRKSAKLPKFGEARSRPPEIDESERLWLLNALGEDIGRRDRLPYTPKFDLLVDQFNQGKKRPLSPHLVWRLVATLAK